MPAGLGRRVFVFFFHCDIVSIIVHGGAQPELTQTLNKMLSMCAQDCGFVAIKGVVLWV